MSRAVDLARAPGLGGCGQHRDRQGSSCRLVYRHARSRYSTVHLAFDIFQGIGVAAAVGIRPFLPGARGRRAGGRQRRDPLQGHRLFVSCRARRSCLLLVVGVVVAGAARAAASAERLERGPGLVARGGLRSRSGRCCSPASLARGHYAVWPGYIGGVICAAVGIAATTAAVRAGARAARRRRPRPLSRCTPRPPRSCSRRCRWWRRRSGRSGSCCCCGC